MVLSSPHLLLGGGSLSFLAELHAQCELEVKPNKVWANKVIHLVATKVVFLHKALTSCSA